MKNKLLTLLTVTLLTGSMLIGCGGNETGTDNGENSGTGTNTEANVNTEIGTNSDDNTAKIDPNLEYTETQIANLFANEADIDKSMVDGTEVPNTTAENVQQIVKVKAKVDLYNKSKERIGYLKDGVTIAFVNIDNEWCIIGSTDYSEIYYALATDMTPVIEVVDDTNSDVESDEKDSVVMSDRAKAFFDKVRKGFADVNANNAALKAEHPEYTYVEIVETDSSDGLELIATLIPSLDYDEELSVNSIIANITEGGYSQYYFEYITEKESPDPELGTYVEFNLYAK